MDNPWKDKATNPRQGKVVGSTTTVPGITKLGEIVGSTTMEPTGTDPANTVTQEEKLNILEKLHTVEKAINQLDIESKESKRQREYAGCFAFLTSDMDRSTSPATSTPAQPLPQVDIGKEG